MAGAEVAVAEAEKPEVGEIGQFHGGCQIVVLGEFASIGVTAPYVHRRCAKTDVEGGGEGGARRRTISLFSCQLLYLFGGERG